MNSSFLLNQPKAALEPILLLGCQAFDLDQVDIFIPLVTLLCSCFWVRSILI